jgi:hypothetical protein
MTMSLSDETYYAARARFDATAGLDHPDLPEDPAEALQTRLYRWQIRSYGVPDRRDIALGVVEELGELAEAAGDHASEADAVADTAIYAIQLCTLLRLDAASLMAPPSTGFYALPSAMAIAGRLSHVALKSHQRIRGMGDPEASRRAFAEVLATLFGLLHLRARGVGKQLYPLVAEVAEQVMKRDKSKLPPVRAQEVA